MTPTYLDTNVTVWLAQGSLERLSQPAVEHLRTQPKCLLSPMVLLEMQFLYEIKRLLISPTDIQRKLEHELGVRVCEADFPAIAVTALNESWTRDPFDRLITAHARTNGLAWLITSDQRIREFYPRVIW